MQELGRSNVESALAEIGEILFRAWVVAEIAVFGGAAILFQFAAEFRTSDIDARLESGDHGAVMAAARAVAERHGWLRSRFSEAVTSYLSLEADTSLHASYPSKSRMNSDDDPDRIVFPQRLQNSQVLLEQILRPERYGFMPCNPGSQVTLGRHVLGMTDSRFISSSRSLFGSPRFEGRRYWIDEQRLRASGATV